MPNLLRYLLLFLLSSAAATPSSGQDVGVDFDATVQAIGSLQISSRILFERTCPCPESTDGAPTAEQVERTVGDLTRAWIEAGTPALPWDYINALRAHADTLQALAGTSQVGSPPPTVLKLILSDLEAKLDLATLGDLALAGLDPTPFPVSVLVEVTVVRDGEEVDGLWVRSDLSLYGRTAHPRYVFSSASSPTRRSLPPGHYVMWVEDADGTLLASQPVTVGVSGLNPEPIQFALPASTHGADTNPPDDDGH